MQATIIVASIVFMAEIGCILRSACFVEQYGKWSILGGTILGTSIAAILGIFLGDFISRSLPHGLANWIAGCILIVIGALMLFGNHSCGHH